MPIAAARLLLLLLLTFTVGVSSASAAPPRVVDDAPMEEAVAPDDDGDDADELDGEAEAGEDGIGEGCDDRDTSLRAASDEEPTGDAELDALDDEDDAELTAGCDDEAEARPAKRSLTGVLKRGSFDGGRVTVKRAATVEQTLTLAGAKGRKGRTVLGQSARKLAKGGTVSMTVRLTKAGRAALKRSTGTAKVTLVTKVRIKGASTRTTALTTTLTRA